MTPRHLDTVSIEAQARALRAQATRDMFKTLASWIKGLRADGQAKAAPKGAAHV